MTRTDRQTSIWRRTRSQVGDNKSVCSSQHFNVLLDEETDSKSQPEDMEKGEEEEDNNGVQQRKEILSEVASLLHEDSVGSSDRTLPYSPLPDWEEL